MPPFKTFLAEYRLLTPGNMDNFLKQIVTEPTRDENVLDLVLSNNDNMIGEVDVGSQLGRSYDREIRFIFKWEENRDNLVLVPDFRKANYEGLRRYLEEVNWESLGIGGDGQENCLGGCYNILVKAIGEGQQHIPYCPLRKNNSKPKWMTRGLKHETALKRRPCKIVING